MSDDLTAGDLALRLAGYVEGGLAAGWLDGAPAFWVRGIRERMVAIDRRLCEAQGRREQVEGGRSS
jgi:hypothetical protein